MKLTFDGKDYSVATDVTDESGRSYKYNYGGLSCNRLDWIADRIVDDLREEVLRRLYAQVPEPPLQPEAPSAHNSETKVKA